MILEIIAPTIADAEACFRLHLDSMPQNDRARMLIEVQLEKRNLLRTALVLSKRHKEDATNPNEALTEAVKYIIYINGIGHTLFRNELYAITDLSIRSQLQSMEQIILTETLENTSNLEEFVTALSKRVGEERIRLEKLSEVQPTS